MWYSVVLGFGFAACALHLGLSQAYAQSAHNTLRPNDSARTFDQLMTEELDALADFSFFSGCTVQAVDGIGPTSREEALPYATTRLQAAQRWFDSVAAIPACASDQLEKTLANAEQDVVKGHLNAIYPLLATKDCRQGITRKLADIPLIAAHARAISRRAECGIADSANRQSPIGEQPRHSDTSVCKNPKDWPEFNGTYRIISHAGVVLSSHPDSSRADRIVGLAKDSEVTLLGMAFKPPQSDGVAIRWAYVETISGDTGMEGWIPMKYLAPTPR